MAYSERDSTRVTFGGRTRPVVRATVTAAFLLIGIFVLWLALRLGSQTGSGALLLNLGTELIGIAGGDDIFPERATASLGRDRIVGDAGEVISRQPDIIIGSWCGKKFRTERVAARPGWQDIPAVRDGELPEVKSPLILQPGPAALTDGLDALHTIVARWAMRR